MHIWLTIILFTALFSGNSHAVDGIALYESLRRSVVTVTSMTPANGQGRLAILSREGSGVIIDARGIIATNTHIIQNAKAVRVTLPDGNTHMARVVYAATADDLALLQINSDTPFEPVTWARNDQVTLGEEVITLGHCPLLKTTISGGRVHGIGVRRNDPARTPEFIQLNINHYEGDSGGPVFDRRGQFLGIMSSKPAGSDRICLAVPVNKIRAAYLSQFNLADPLQRR